MINTFDDSGKYYESVKLANARVINIRAMSAFRTQEKSNDVIFEASRKNTLILELSGTAAHMTDMNGKIARTITRRDQICLVPAGLRARFAWQTLGPVQHSFVVEFADDFFQIYCPEIVDCKFARGGLIPQNYTEKHRLLVVMQSLANQIEVAGAHGRLLAESAARLLAAEVAASDWSRKPRLAAEPAPQGQRVGRAIDYIEAHFSEDVSLLELSRVSGLGPTHLTKLFKRHAGMTPYAYVIRRRLRHAVYLLTQSDAPISQLAVDAGFADQQHMTHVFSRHFGRTPNSFRQDAAANSAGQP
jgi:AraC family transcriptional regulator